MAPIAAAPPRPTKPEEPDLDRTFAALAHPARRAMLRRLAEGPALPSELAAPFDMSQPAVSKHLRVLEDAGLISRGRDAQRRPCELRTGALADADQWMGDFRRTWEERLDRLGDYLTEIQQQTKHHDKSDSDNKEGRRA